MNTLHVTAPLALLVALVAGVRVPSQDQDIRWRKDLDAATREAADSTRPLLIVFR